MRAPSLASAFTISIHPPRVGRDAETRGYVLKEIGFQSTLPVWGGTPGPHVRLSNILHFNPPSPCGEGPLP